MKIIQNIKSWLSKKVDVKTYLVEVMPRAWHEQRNVGGMRITLRFVKTTKRFGRVKIEEKTETFNNYHDRKGKFTYNPTYVPGPDARSEDEMWHWIGVWNDCETYPFAPVTTHWLQQIIDNWIKENKLDCGGEWGK